MDTQPNDDFTQPETQTQNLDRRSRRSSGGWIGGAILIALGLILLLQNFTTFRLDNWWALFILLPAVGAFSNAWDAYQNAGGRLTSHARGSLFGGLVLVVVSATFLFNLSWNIIGPVLLLVAGAGMVINGMLPK